MFGPIILINDSIQLSLQKRFVNYLLETIFIIRLFHVRSTLFNYGCVINILNTIFCILFEQHSKTIIFIFIVYRSEFIKDSFTEMIFLRSIINRMNLGITCHFRITGIYINCAYAFLDYNWDVI